MVKSKLTKEVPKVSENEVKISTKEPTELGKREPRSKAVISLGPAQNTRSRVKSKESHSNDSKTRNLVMSKQSKKKVKPITFEIPVILNYAPG